MPELIDVPEASVQTYTLGAPLNIDASGVAAEVAAASAVTLFGFAAKAGQNGASTAAKTAKIYKITPGDRFEGTLSVASWKQELVGSRVALSKISSTFVLVTHTDVSASGQAIVLGPANSNVAAGDQTPPVIFSVLHIYTEGGIA